MSETLGQAVSKLVQTYQEFRLPGIFAPANAEQLSVIKQKLDLPPSLIEWYSIASPQNVEIPTRSLNLVLNNSDYLNEALIGYRTDAITGEELSDWDSTWLVMGGEGEHPIIIPTNSADDTKIYYAEPTEVAWELKMLSLDLEGFLLGIIDYINLYVGQYKQQIHKEDERLRPEFVADFEIALDQRSSTTGRSQMWLGGLFGYWI